MRWEQTHIPRGLPKLPLDATWKAVENGPDEPIYVGVCWPSKCGAPFGKFEPYLSVSAGCIDLALDICRVLNAATRVSSTK